MNKQILTLLLLAFMVSAESGDVVTPKPDSAFLILLHATTEIDTRSNLVLSLEGHLLKELV